MYDHFHFRKLRAILKEAILRKTSCWGVRLDYGCAQGKLDPVEDPGLWVAFGLNYQGVVVPNGQGWGAQSLQWHKLRQNPVYHNSSRVQKMWFSLSKSCSFGIELGILYHLRIGGRIYYLHMLSFFSLHNHSIELKLESFILRHRDSLTLLESDKEEMWKCGSRALWIEPSDSGAYAVCASFIISLKDYEE